MEILVNVRLESTVALTFEYPSARDKGKQPGYQGKGINGNSGKCQIGFDNSIDIRKPLCQG